MDTAQDGHEKEDIEMGTKGNKKGQPIWSFVKNTSLFITLCVFVLTSVLVLDAYKFVSVRHAKFARAKIFQTLQSMDPTIIESHTGMKVLTNDEYTQLQSNLDSSRREARQMNSKVQLKFSQVLETATAVEKMKKDIEELKKVIEEKEKESDKKSGEADAVMEKTTDADAAKEADSEVDNDGKEKTITTNEKNATTDSEMVAVDDAAKTSRQ